MMFSIAVAIMVILVTAFWAYQGIFSSMIMFFEAVIANMIAFAYYEQLNKVWAEQLDPEIGFPLALMLLFLAVLLALRLLTDKIIPSNIRVHVYVDRAGGSVFGFLTGLTLIGMVLISIQMLPIGSGILGFERMTTDKEGQAQENNFFFSPDRFAVGMANMLSNGRFTGDNPLSYAKPDLVRDLYAARAAPQPEARMYLPSDALVVKAYWETHQIDQVNASLEDDRLVREFETTEPLDSNSKFLVCYVNIDVGAAKKGKLEIHFRIPQFRLVGPPPTAEGHISIPPHLYYAVGVSDIYTHQKYGPEKVGPKQCTRLVRFNSQTDFVLSPDLSRAVAKVVRTGENEAIKNWRFDVAFEVPEDFEPWYLEFKRDARFDLTKLKKLPDIPDWASRARGSSDESQSVKPKGPKVGQAPGGHTHVANAIKERTGATRLLPIPMDRSDSIVARHANGDSLRGGDNCHFWVEIPTEKIASENQVRKFEVPANQRMIQIGAQVLKAESMYGRALNFASRITAQIYIKDSNGKDYFAIGQYAAVEIRGKTIFEIQYYPNAGMPERCLKKPRKITHRILTRAGRNNSKFGYLFLVDPGTHVASFHAGRGKSQRLNIQAPA